MAYEKIGKDSAGKPILRWYMSWEDWCDWGRKQHQVQVDFKRNTELLEIAKVAGLDLLVSGKMQKRKTTADGPFWICTDCYCREDNPDSRCLWSADDKHQWKWFEDFFSGEQNDQVP